MDFKRKDKHCSEIYKTLKISNPSFVTEIFELRSCSRPVREQYKPNLNILKKLKSKSLE